MLRRNGTREANRGAGVAGFRPLGFVGPGTAGNTALGSATGASGRNFGAALDPGDFDEKPYRELATRVTPGERDEMGLVEPLRGALP
jgi:hypothetical protein